MCGIVGIISRNKSGFFGKEVTIFEQMLFAGQLRGHHGTGMFYNSKKHPVKTLKGPIPSADFIEDKNYNIAIKEVYNEATYCVGHNRWATKGAHIHANTHPFREGNVTLVHNGTLHYHKDIADVEVDSHAICHSINTIGTEKTLSKIDGAFTLVWHDKRNNSLNLIRNSERPLHIFETNGAIFFCSEVGMGRWILERNGTKITKDYSLEVGNLMVVDLDTLAITNKVMELYKKPAYNPYPYYKNKPIEVWNPKTLRYEPEEIKEDNTKVAQIKDKVSKNTGYKYNGIGIGDRIQVFPMQIRKNGAATYLECYHETETKDYECKYYNPNIEALTELTKKESLIGTVTAIGSLAGEKFFIFSTLYPGVISKNNYILSELEAKSLPKMCHCCGGHFSNKLTDIPKCNIIQSTVTNQLDVYCEDCTHWSDETLDTMQQLKQALN